MFVQYFSILVVSTYATGWPHKARTSYYVSLKLGVSFWKINRTNNKQSAFTPSYYLRHECYWHLSSHLAHCCTIQLQTESSVQQTITRSALLGASISVRQHANAKETANCTFLWWEKNIQDDWDWFYSPSRWWR